MSTGLTDNDPQVCAVCGNPIHFQTGDGWRRFTCRAGFNPRTGRWTKSCRRAFDVALALKAQQAAAESALTVAIAAMDKARSGMSYAVADRLNLHTAINQALAAKVGDL